MLAANTQASNGWNSKNRANKSVDRILPVAAPTTMLRVVMRLNAMPNSKRNRPENIPDSAPAAYPQDAPAMPGIPARGMRSVEAATPRGRTKRVARCSRRASVLRSNALAASSVSDTAMMETRYVVSSSDSPCP